MKYTAMILLAAATTAFGAANSFDTDPNWTGANNTASGSSYGYSAKTANAGGQEGEVGGTVARADAESSYVDTKIGDFTLANPLEVTGKIYIGNTATWDGVAHVGFRSASADDTSFLGLELMESNEGQVRARASLQRGDGGASAPDFSIIPTGAYTFKLSYDPNGGANTQGTLSITLTDGAGSHTLTLDLSESDRSMPTTLNAFGIAAPGLANPDPIKTVDIFLDDVNHGTK